MSCGANEVMGLDYCDMCMCMARLCPSCQVVKDLADFSRTTSSHLLQVPALLGRVYDCDECVENVDVRYRKISSLSPSSVLVLDDERMYYSHIEGKFALCYTVTGTLKELPKGLWIEAVTYFQEEIDLIVSKITETEHDCS